jgi:hypothetical protein
MSQQSALPRCFVAWVSTGPDGAMQPSPLLAVEGADLARREDARPEQHLLHVAVAEPPQRGRLIRKALIG